MIGVFARLAVEIDTTALYAIYWHGHIDPDLMTAFEC